MRSRFCYAALWALAFPVLLFYLLYRSMAQSGYRKSLSERFARYDKTPLNPIWLHAASLGEVNAAAPLLVELRRDYPDVPLLISCQTPAGRQAALALTIDNCTCLYLPFDVRVLTQKFVARIQPRMALIFETEIWPNLFLSIKQAGVPLLMINARITERSVRRYAKLTGIFANALALADQIACQSDADAARFIEAGAKPESISVFGNIKWDKAPDEAVFKLAETLKSSWLQQPIWMAASTHSDEESVVLETHRKVLANWPNAMLLWAPRHPERFQPVCDLALALGFSVRLSVWL